MTITRAALLTGIASLAAAWPSLTSRAFARPAGAGAADDPWRRKLSPAAYAVLREAGTEAPGSSALENESRAGSYACAGCDSPLFSSQTKFHSGTGWPSFYAALPHAVATSNDASLGMARTEVHCTRCAGHLGHVFDDGPQPTGLRYCINGVALTFHPRGAR